MIRRLVPKVIAGIWAPLLLVALTLANTQQGLFADRAAFADGYMLGDVNRDGRVNSIDALFLLYFQAGFICSLPPPEESGCPISQLGKGDVNEDGVANAFDAILILQYHAGLLAALPPAG